MTDPQYLIDQPDIAAIIDSWLADTTLSLADVERRLNDDHGDEETGYPRSSDANFLVEEAIERLEISPLNCRRLLEWLREWPSTIAAETLLEDYGDILRKDA